MNENLGVIAETVLSRFNEELVNMLADSWLLIAFIAVVSVGMTEAIKISLTRGWELEKIKSWKMWSINIVNSLLCSTMIVVIFDGLETIWRTFMYTGLLFIISWSASVILYGFIIKVLFKAMSTAKNKIEEGEIESLNDVELSKIKLVESKILLVEKMRELKLLKEEEKLLV